MKMVNIGYVSLIPQNLEGILEDLIDDSGSGGTGVGGYVWNSVQASTSGMLYGYKKIFPQWDVPFVIIQVIEVDNGNLASGNKINGVFSGATYYAIRCKYDADVTAINTFIGRYISDPDAIISMRMVPSDFLLDYDPDAQYSSASPLVFKYVLTDHDVSNIFSKGFTYLTDATRNVADNLFPFPTLFNALTGIEQLDGYAPRNKKLYTYPYNFLELDNTKGDSIALRYEFFNDASTGERDLRPKFVCYTTMCEPAQATMMPVNYKGLLNDEPAFNEQITLETYPSCSWNADYYKMWVNQNMNPLMWKAEGNFLGGVALGSVTGPIGSAIGLKNAIESVSVSLGNAYQASLKADIGKGNFQNANVLFSADELGIRAGRMSINRNNAQIIDQYFDRFGYATNLLKVPNTHSRARWCYTKTVACTISGSIPSDDARRICEIYNNGITFWRNGQSICDYSNPETNIPNGEVGD